MKKINIHILITFLLSTLLIAKYYFDIKKIKKDYHHLVQDYSLLVENSNDVISFLVKKDSLQMLTNNSLFSKVEEQINLSNNSFNGKSFIVFRFNEEDCYSCYNNFLDEIELIINDKKYKKKLYIFAKFSNIRDLNVKFENKEFNIINLKNKLDLPIEKLKVPYFFVVNNGVCSNFFALDKSHLNNAYEYINRY